MTNITTPTTALLNDLLTCGSCGAAMESAIYEGRGRYYRCTGNQDRCTTRPTDATRIERDVLSHAAEALLDEKGFSGAEQWKAALRTRIMPDFLEAASDPERRHIAMLAIANGPPRFAQAEDLPAARELVKSSIRQVILEANEINVQFPNPALDRSGQLGCYYGPAGSRSEMF